MAFDTGNGTVLAFTSGAFSGAIIDVDLGDVSIEMLEASVLSTTGDKEKEVADLRDNGPWTVRYFVDVTNTNKWAPAVGVVYTFTATFPSQTVGSDATFAATGAVTNVKRPTMANDTLAEGTFEFTPDGKTGPTFVAEAAS